MLQPMTPAESRMPVVEEAVDTSARKGRVLVAIPCFNEEQYIGEVVRQARQYAEEVLVIDDGSTDRTVEVAAFAGATVVRNPGNKGKGYGIRRAFDYAYAGDFDAIVLMDGDMQHNPNEIPLLIDPILREAAPVHLALGFRFGESTEMPWWRRVGKRVLDYATAIAGAGQVTDSQCGYRAFSRRAIHIMQSKLIADGFSVESEQLIIARGAGLAMENVRITCRYEGLDGSTKNPLVHAFGVLKDLIVIGARNRPTTLVALPGLVLLMATTAVFAVASDLRSDALALTALSAVAVVGVAAVSVGAALTVLRNHESSGSRPPRR